MSTNFNFDGSRVFFTSDTHFNHANIIRFCERPFKSVEEMNESLIRNWNSVVGIHFVRDLEQGKKTLQMDKVNDVLRLFGECLGPVKAE